MAAAAPTPPRFDCYHRAPENETDWTPASYTLWMADCTMDEFLARWTPLMSVGITNQELDCGLQWYITRAGIAPTYEDPRNENGGAWSIPVSTTLMDRGILHGYLGSVLRAWSSGEIDAATGWSWGRVNVVATLPRPKRSHQHDIQVWIGTPDDATKPVAPPAPATMASPPEWTFRLFKSKKEAGPRVVAPAPTRGGGGGYGRRDPPGSSKDAGAKPWSSAGASAPSRGPAAFGPRAGAGAPPGRR